MRGGRGIRRWPLILAVVASLAGLAQTAAAADGLRLADCPAAAESASCARLAVPLDPTGAVPGTVDIFIAQVAPPRPARGVVLALAGGPGQAAVPFTSAFAAELAPILGDRTLVVIDQRGTGRSGFLRCRALQPFALRRPLAGSARLLLQAGRDPVGPCVERLGPSRSLYTTAQSVADIEAVRVALGAPRIAIHSVSYGTRVADAYARTYPDRVERLVLDSVVLVEGSDPFVRSTIAAIPAALRDICSGGACRSFTADPVADLNRLAARLASRPLAGTVFGLDGRGREMRLTPARLLGLLKATDADSSRQVQLPAAVRSALDGDPAPILRLAFGYPAEVDRASALSNLLFVTTICEEEPVPWDRAVPTRDRLTQLEMAAAAVRPRSVAPFSIVDALVSGHTPQCITWPAAAAALPSPPPVTDVPVLALAGVRDLRTPVGDARRVARRQPRGQLLIVPGAGHSVIGSDRSGCARRAVRDFFADRAVRRCRRAMGDATAPEPRSLSQLRGREGLPVRAGRLVEVADEAFNDTLDALNSLPAGRGGGLHGGSFVATGGLLTLRNLVHTPGVRISGTLRGPNSIGVLRIRSRFGSGAIRYLANGGLAGRIGGRPVSLPAGTYF